MRKLKPTKKLSQHKNKPLKISLCYIVKNEERNLTVSLNSLKGFVDEIIVVDTGSTDNTIEVAKSFGAKVLESPWNNDFSTPRNLALDNATGDWILFLDADEYIPDGKAQNLRAVIEQGDKHNREGLLVNLVNIDVDRNNKVLDTTYILRMYKKLPGLRYHGRIHEELRRGDGSNIAIVSMIPTNLIELYHTGYSAKVNAAKATRNLNMLLAELKITDHPENIYGYIAQCYNGLKDYVNAEKYAILDINGGRRGTTFASSSYRILLSILARDPQRMAGRLEYIVRASKDLSEVLEFYAEHAKCLATQADYKTKPTDESMSDDKF